MSVAINFWISLSMVISLFWFHLQSYLPCHFFQFSNYPLYQLFLSQSNPGVSIGNSTFIILTKDWIPFTFPNPTPSILNVKKKEKKNKIHCYNNNCFFWILEIIVLVLQHKDKRQYGSEYMGILLCSRWAIYFTLKCKLRISLSYKRQLVRQNYFTVFLYTLLLLHQGIIYTRNCRKFNLWLSIILKSLQ